MREKGSGPKQIARALGLKPARASALVRRLAHEQQSTAGPTARPVVGCWVSAGWSTDLELSEAPDWARADAIRDQIAAAGIEVEDTPTGPKWSV